MGSYTEYGITRLLARSTFRDALCIVPNVTRFGGEIDLLVVKSNLKLIDCEVKISRGDLLADGKKDKWWKWTPGRWDADLKDYVRPPKTPLEWPRATWKHYYAMPAEIWDEALLPRIAKTSGILLVGNYDSVKCRRPAKANPEAKPMSVGNFHAVARLATLRMWDALNNPVRRN